MLRRPLESAQYASRDYPSPESEPDGLGGSLSTQLPWQSIAGNLGLTVRRYTNQNAAVSSKTA